jgi:uncharacterized protein YndB with AHSA1/START domain
MDELDRIERHIDIEADADRVWGLVSRPGWWINEGDILSNQSVEQRDDHHVVRHAVHGEFAIRTERLDPPRYAAFRWLPQEADEMPAEATTLVEFRIEDRAGGVRLSVVESGFSTLSEDRAAWVAARDENVEGWRLELAAARTHLDPVAVTRTVNLPVPSERVWPLLVDGDQLARWYAFGGAALDPTPGGRVELRWAEHGTFRGRVVDVTPHELLSLRLAVEPDTDPGDGRATLVSFTLRPSGEGGTLLTVRQSGYPELDDALGTPDELAAQDREGWEAGLGLLDGLVAASAEAGAR